MRLFEGTEFDIPPRCERCEKLEAACDCPPPVPEAKRPEKQTAKIRIEKRKRSKLVTTISGLDSTGDHLKNLLTKLKNHCGAGGSIQESVIEIQGDHGQRICDFLCELGYRVKK